MPSYQCIIPLKTVKGQNGLEFNIKVCAHWAKRRLRWWFVLLTELLSHLLYFHDSSNSLRWFRVRFISAYMEEHEIQDFGTKYYTGSTVCIKRVITIPHTLVWTWIILTSFTSTLAEWGWLHTKRKTLFKDEFQFSFRLPQTSYSVVEAGDRGVRASAWFPSIAEAFSI